MRAVVTNGVADAGVISVVEVPEPPAPGPGEILVRVSAASLNYRDLLVGRGLGRWRPPAGRILGSDAAGIVVARGVGVRFPELGDRVVGAFLPNWLDGPATPEKMTGSLGGAARDGVFAEYALLDAASAVIAPAHMSDAEASGLVCAGVTAWHALTRAESLRPDRTILVQGTGGVSMSALAMGRAAGARVIVTSSSDSKLVRARALGASHTINYRKQPQWDQAALRLTGGRGVDHVLDVGGAATLSRSIASTAYEGIVSVVGLLGGLTAEIDVSAVFLKNLNLHGVETGSRAMLDDLARWSERTGFRPEIGGAFALKDAELAFAALEKQTVVGKICLHVDRV